MDTFEAIQKRRSIRKYVKKPLPESDLLRLLDAARLAPSGMNKQDWELVVVTDQKTKDSLVPLCRDQKFISDASVFIAGVDAPGEKWHRVDLAIAMEHIAIAASSMGLGTCWIGAFQPDKVAALLGIPGEKTLVVCMVAGFPDENPLARNKKPIEQLVRREKW